MTLFIYDECTIQFQSETFITFSLGQLEMKYLDFMELLSTEPWRLLCVRANYLHFVGVVVLVCQCEIFWLTHQFMLWVTIG